MEYLPVGRVHGITVYLVVTVTVNRRQVVIPVVAVIAIEVMDFDQRWRREDESTRLQRPCWSLSNFAILFDTPGWCPRRAAQ